MFPVILFLVTYIPAGILAALYNRNAPYSSAYFIGLTLSVFNMIFTIFVMGINTWVDSDSTFLSLILGAGACVLASFATVHLAPGLQVVASGYAVFTAKTAVNNAAKTYAATNQLSEAIDSAKETLGSSNVIKYKDFSLWI
jgi:hypothetical protein